MNGNPEATDYVLARLNEAGIRARHVQVRSRDVTSRVCGTWDTLAMVRTSVSMADGRPVPERLGSRIGRILADLPGANPDVRVTDVNVIVLWDGDI